MKKFNLKVQGMTCASCEVLLERAMKKVEGVAHVHVSRAKEKASIHCEDTVQLEDLQAAVADKGYVLIAPDIIQEPVRAPFIVKNKRTFAHIGAALLFIVGVYLLLNQFNLIPEGVGVTDNMSYGFIFVIGLIAATSTCLAVAGGLLLAVANKYNAANPALTGRQKFKPHIWFNIGRVVSYVLLGAAIGALGSVLSISPTVTGIITILASLFMIVMGIQLLQIFPWMNKIQLKMPKFIAHKIYDRSHQDQKVPSKLSSFLFGGSTFFLPCGFTQALQLYVLGKADPTIGALTMLAFSLGTLPALAGIGALSSFTKGKTQRAFTTFSAVLIIVLGAIAMPSGLTLVGVTPSVDLPDEPLMSVDMNDQVQVLELKVNGLDYEPTGFRVRQGVPVELHVDGSGAIGCAQMFSIPDLGIDQRLSRDGVTTFSFTPEEKGKLVFSCSMGMAGPGVIEVV